MKKRCQIVCACALGLSQVALWPASPNRLQVEANEDAVSPNSTETGWRRPSLQAIRVGHGPDIDGHLDDEVWSHAPAGTPRYEAYEHPGRLMTDHTVVNRYWGDVHGHTIHSDGKGTVADYFQYARDVAHLDFAIVTKARPTPCAAKKRCAAFSTGAAAPGS